MNYLKKALLNAIIYIFLLLNFVECTKDYEEELKKQIRFALAKDSTISQNEWDGIVSYIKINANNLTAFVSNDTVNCEGLKKYIINISKKNPIIESPCNAYKIAPPLVKIFLENSQSMDGYVKGQTDFESVLIRLFADLGYLYNKDSIQVSFINSKESHLQRLPEDDFTSSIKQFVESLEPEKNPWESTGGDSELNQVLNLTLNKTGPNDVSVLVSDFIYSLHDTNPLNGLVSAQSLTYSAFHNQAKEKAILVWQLKSNFSGKYWTMYKKEKFESNIKRPYYIWFISSPSRIRHLTQSLNSNNYQGYQNRLTFFPITQEINYPVGSVLSAKNKIGTFRFDGSDKTRMSISKAAPERGIFQFTLAADLSQLTATDSYIMDTYNYTVSTGFKLIRIDKITSDIQQSFANKGPEKNDWKRISDLSATHLLTLRAEGDFQRQPITVTLNDQLPGWVKLSHTDNDSTGPDSVHTFGLKYLINGVNEAYNSSNNVPAIARFTIKLQ